MKFVILPILIVLISLLTACGPPTPTYRVKVMDTPSQPNLPPTQRPYTVNDQKYSPIPDAQGFSEEGLASWYGKDFHGRKTSNGEIYDMYAMTAAHKILPMNVFLKVTNLNSGQSAVVRVNDRGPFVKSRIIDLSYSAAKQLGVVGPGTAQRFFIRVLGPCGSYGHRSRLVCFDGVVRMIADVDHRRRRNAPPVEDVADLLGFDRPVDRSRLDGVEGVFDAKHLERDLRAS